MILIYAFAAVLTAAAAVMTTMQTVLTLLFRRRGHFFGRVPRGSFPRDGFSRRRRVSILKPVCGIDDDLEANLESFAALRGVDCEVIVSIADPADAARPIAERVARKHGWQVVIGGDPARERGNRKIARLIAAMPYARGDVVFIADSNVRVEPDDVARTVAAFDDPRTGCVSNLFTGAGAESFGASIESLHLLSFVAPGAVIAAAAGVPCVVGKSMAIRRDVLTAIGGFEAFANVLAEDQAMGLAVRDAGCDVVLSPVVVRNVTMRRTLRRALDRQVRWNKIRYAFSKATYGAELLLFPLPYALVAALAIPVLPIAIVALRLLQVALLARATGAPLRARELALVPLFDLLHFGATFPPSIDHPATSRGYPMRLGPNTVLLDAAA